MGHFHVDEEVSPMMWYGSDGPPWWGWLVMCVTMVAFWAVVIGAVWYAVARATRSEPSRAGRPAEQILDERFARGEIDMDEYSARRASLRGDTPRGRSPAATAR